MYQNGKMVQAPRSFFKKSTATFEEARNKRSESAKQEN